MHSKLEASPVPSPCSHVESNEESDSCPRSETIVKVDQNLIGQSLVT